MMEAAAWRNRLGFGVGGFGVALVYSACGVLLLYFYTKVCGLSPKQAGTILFFAALADAVMDPLVGWLASRTRTRWGRYRPYLLFGAVPMSLAFIALFASSALPESEMFRYALVTLVIFRGAFQLIYMPYTSMIAVLSRDADERSDIESWRAWFIAAGSLAVSFYGIALVKDLGDGDDARGFLEVAILIAALCCASFLFTAAVSRELPDSRQTADVSNLLSVARLLVRNHPFCIVVLGTFLAQAAYAIVLSASVTFFEQHFGNRELARWPLTAATAAGLVVAPLWPGLSRRHGKRITWMCGVVLAAAALLLLYLLNPETVTTYALMFFFLGCGLQAGLVIQFAAAADSLDYGEWKTGQRTEAVGFAMMTFTMKGSLAVGNGLAGWLYGVSGFVPGVVADAQTLEGMRATLLLVPALGFATAAVAIHFYSLSTAQHREIVSALRKAQA
jgi:glycoside/pentoside/hexuronide:cation symporter, GPH family